VDAPIPEPTVPAAKVDEPAIVPDEYELELAADSVLSEADLEEIAVEAERLGLGKEDAQKFLTMRENAFKAGQSKYEAIAQEALKKEYETISKDPMYLGEEKIKTQAYHHAVLKEFGNDEFNALMNDPKWGNNIILAKFLRKVGEALPDDVFQSSLSEFSKGTHVPEVAAVDSIEARMYPSYYKK
jgi:hypothetical protein